MRRAVVWIINQSVTTLLRPEIPIKNTPLSFSNSCSLCEDSVVDIKSYLFACSDSALVVEKTRAWLYESDHESQELVMK